MPVRVHNPHPSRRSVSKPVQHTQYVGLDIETTGLYPVPGKDKIFCVAVNFGSYTEVYTDPNKVKKICEDKSICKVIHNAAFDSFWLKMLHGIDVVNIWDSKLMEQVLIGDNLITEESKTPIPVLEELSSSLKYTLKRYKFPVHDKALSYNFSVRPHNTPLTKQEIDYVKDDVKYLLDIQRLQQVRLERLDLLRVAGLENACVEVTVEMQANGLGIDKALWNKIEQDNINKRDYILKRLPAQVENWNSPAQVKKYFQSIGIPLTTFDDLTDDFTAKYNNETLNKFVEMRKYSTFVSKYGGNFFLDKKSGRYLIDTDNRIRPSFDQVKNTGRYGVSRPPVHGLPREGSHKDAIRARKGHNIVSGDFSGQEIGIMAAASGEELWIKALFRGEDPLSLMASIMFSEWKQGTEKGCTFPFKCKCGKHKELRQISKEVTYGIAYGAYPKSVSVKIKRTVKETAILFRKFSKAAPKLNRWLNDNAKETIKTRISYSADIYKRRRTIRDPQEWQVRNVGFNNPVQACAANMTKLALISISKELPKIFVWHDAIYLEVPKAKAKAAAKELKAVMEKSADYCTGIKGLIKVEPKISLSLAA